MIACISALILAFTTMAVSTPVDGGTPAYVELKTQKAVAKGRIEAFNKELCWLMDRDGRLSRVQLRQVTGQRQISKTFRRYTAAELRNNLVREFGRDFEVKATEHYLVCARRGTAAKYAEVFEDIYRTFHIYFRTRGFDIDRPEFPLVAIVFPSHKEFVACCRRDGVTNVSGLRGYYLRTTNRAVLYDPDRQTSELTGMRESVGGSSASRIFSRHGTITGNLRDTIVHETAHQVAFNVGLHNRMGSDPKWVVEGLATVFEAPGIRDRSSHHTVASRVNRERLIWFKNYVAQRRTKKSLAEFVSGDVLFQTNALDAYSQAWALNFFLLETRPRAYTNYLQTIARRDPLRPVTPEDRLKGFQSAFGKDIDLLEAEFLRYISRLL